MRVRGANIGDWLNIQHRTSNIEIEIAIEIEHAEFGPDYDTDTGGGESKGWRVLREGGGLEGS
jgi:hypothetical protein